MRRRVMSSTQIAGFATDRPDNRIHSESESAKPVEDFSRVERAARGRAERTKVSRSSHGAPLGRDGHCWWS